jgi:hypothetical protein
MRETGRSETSPKVEWVDMAAEQQSQHSGENMLVAACLNRQFREVDRGCMRTNGMQMLIVSLATKYLTQVQR